MQILWRLALSMLCCLSVILANEGSGSQKKEVTLKNLYANDPHIELVAHPQICGNKGDFPKGRELVFFKRESKEFVHAVFPNKAKSPRDRSGTFELKGYYQGIQKKARFRERRKELIDNYRYFVVTSWSKQELE